MALVLGGKNNEKANRISAKWMAFIVKEMHFPTKWNHFSTEWIHFSSEWTHFSSKWIHFSEEWKHFIIKWNHFATEQKHFSIKASEPVHWQYLNFVRIKQLPAMFRLIIITLIFLKLYAPFAKGQEFAVIGDYGIVGKDNLLVSELVKQLDPDFIITVGDNNYPDGDSLTIDLNIGQYYSDYIYPYKGEFGPGAGYNRFFPVLGNHDMRTAGGKPYFDYFELPGNERYYDFIKGDVHFFALNSNLEEPDGTGSDSKQAMWLKDGLAASTSKWKVVYCHHSPYSSSLNGSIERMQWPFQQWGASVVLSGHDHVYESIVRNSFPYFVCGISGKKRYYFNDPVEGSRFRYLATFGAMKVNAYPDSMVFQLYSTFNYLVDSYVLKDSIYYSDFKIDIRAPNPVFADFMLKVELSEYRNVKTELYDVSGNLVAHVMDENLYAGVHEIPISIDGLISGIYYFRVSADDHIATRMLIIIK